MKTAKFFMAFIAAALLASCSDDKDYSGDFGQIKVPDTRQLEQTVSADDTQSARGVTFTTEGAWTSTIAETRAEAPAWISISPDRGDAAGSYTLKITLEPNTSGASRTATIVITCGTSKIEITVTQEGADDPIESTPANRITRIDSHRQTIQNSGNSEPERWTSTSHFAYDDAGRLTCYEWDDTPENSADAMDEVLRISYPDAKTLKLSAETTESPEKGSYTVTLDDAGRAPAPPPRPPPRRPGAPPPPPATTTVPNAGLSPTTATAAAKSAPTRATKPTTTRARSAAGAATTSPVSTSTKARRSISATNSNTTPTCPTRPQCATSTSTRSCSTYVPTSRTPISSWGRYSPESDGWVTAAPI
jgi:hypothetical protein